MLDRLWILGDVKPVGEAAGKISDGEVEVIDFDFVMQLQIGMRFHDKAGNGDDLGIRERFDISVEETFKVPECRLAADRSEEHTSELQSPEVQDEAQVTYAEKLSKEEARIDWSLRSEERRVGKEC